MLNQRAIASCITAAMVWSGCGGKANDDVDTNAGNSAISGASGVTGAAAAGGAGTAAPVAGAAGSGSAGTTAGTTAGTAGTTAGTTGGAMAGTTGGAMAGTTGGAMAGTTGGMAGMAGAAGDAGSGTDDGPLNMAPVTFGQNVRIGAGFEVFMEVTPEGLIFAGWVQGRSCAFSVSKDGGLTWSQPLLANTQANSGGAFAGDTTVGIDDAGNLYAVCQDYASGGLGTNYILLAHSKDDGETWSDFVRVNQSLDKPWLGGTGDGTVLLTWLGRPGGMKRSTDYGATWEQTISLGYINHGTTVSFAPDTRLVHVAYNTGEDTVTYRRSKDLGATFEQARNLSDQGYPCRSPCSPRSHPIVGADADPTGQVVAITWASDLNHPDGEGDDDVWVIVSYDAGDTFTDPIRVNDNMNASRQFQPWAAVDKYGAVHVVWTDLRNGGENATYYARMTDVEAGFEPNVEVTDDTGRPASFLGDYKGIAVDGRDIVVTWADTRDGPSTIYFARAVDAAAAGGPLMQ